jgi:hypothetical protein
MPLTTVPLPVLPDWVDRFHSKIDVKSDDECWPWTAGTDQDGYGIFWLEGKSRRATRLLVERMSGAMPDGHQVLHSCDNPPCMNPGHLSVGTPLDNIRDRSVKGRTARQLGEANGMSSTRRKERACR